MRSRKRNGIDCNLDPPILPIREKGPKWAFFALIEKHSMTRTDKNKHKTPTREGEIAQQKRHSTKSALKNGGAVIFDGSWVLRALCWGRAIPCLSGKKQAKQSGKYSTHKLRIFCVIFLFLFNLFLWCKVR